MTDETADDVARMLDRLYKDRKRVPLADVLREADLMAFPEAVASVFSVLPSGNYTRRRLVDQMNSAIVGRGLSRSLGTFD